MPSRSKKLVRLPLSNPSDILLVKVELTGKRGSKLLDLVLDTGATLTTVPSEIALAIGCDPSKPKSRIEMITASGVEYVPVINIPKMSFLGFHVNNVEAAVLNLPPKSVVAGLLGLNVLSKFDIFLGFRKKTLEISG